MIVALPRAFEFHLWLVAQAESHEIEGEAETAAQLRSLAELVLERPAEFEAYCLVRAAEGAESEARPYE